MSTPFYDLASLVVVPSGYKASKVYAQKPLTTDGQLSFTRSTGASRVASNGLIEKVRTNLLLQSNTFNTTWTASNASVTSGQAGYDGTNNAWLLSKSAASGYISQGPASSGSETISVYAKAGTDNWLHILVRDSASVFFGGYWDLQNGVVGSAIGATTLRIESVGNGWYRCSASFVKSTSNYYRIYPAEGNNDTSGTSGNILIQNAQLETGDIATQPILTTSAAVSVGPVANVPRLDYLNSSCPRLLLEPQRTNLAQFSESFDNAYWTKSATVTANTTISPSGYQDADTFTDSTTSYLDVRRLIAITPNATHTASFFVKKTTGTITHYAGIAVSLTGGSGRADYGIINTNTGAIVRDASSNVNSAAYSSVDYGDYWRVILTFTDNQSNGNCTFILYPAISSNGTSISSNAQGSNVFWGAQLELGSYVSSYVNTLGAAVTRGADACSKTGISSLIGQTEGTLLVELNYVPLQNEPRLIAITETNTPLNNRLIINVNNTNNRVSVISRQSSSITNGSIAESAATALVSGKNKIALGYKSGDSVLYINGVLVATNTQSFTFAQTLGKLFLMTSEVSDVASGIGITNQALLFKTRLTNAQLAELTQL